MTNGPHYRSGYLSLLLPSGTPESRARPLIYQLVVDALAATAEQPQRVTIVTSRGEGEGQVRRWFVEYETGPEGSVVSPPTGGQSTRPCYRPRTSA
jgi:hypothetical protein